jgi:hypothetical protein
MARALRIDRGLSSCCLAAELLFLFTWDSPAVA